MMHLPALACLIFAFALMGCETAKSPFAFEGELPMVGNLTYRN